MARRILAGTVPRPAPRKKYVYVVSHLRDDISGFREVLSPLETILNATVGKNIRITSCDSGYSLNLVVTLGESIS